MKFILIPVLGAMLCLAPPAHSASLYSADGYRLSLPGYKYSFPRDHAAHPEYLTEWWYYTGHLQSRNGRRFGYQITFFRQALTPRLKNRRSKWAVRDIIFAHLALTDETTGKFYFSDRISRAALGLAGAETKTPHVWINDWMLRFRDNMQTTRAASTHDGTAFALDLSQQSLKPSVIHGENGVSQKTAGRGRASHYYSFTRLSTRGAVRIGDERFAVTGQSWFDHEFGSNQLGKNQAGWDWFSLQLADGSELMLYRLRLRGGASDPYSSGTLVEKSGRARHLTLQEFRIEPLGTWRSPASGGRYPARWRLTLPRQGIELDVTPTVANQELNTRGSIDVTYWEGSVRVRGTQRGTPLSGVGYVELTGYARDFNRTF
jgi:predicted secreted hydrolase